MGDNLTHYQAKLTESLAKVQREIHEICQEIGRNPEDIRIIGVTKYHPDEAIEVATSVGLTHLAENRVQILGSRMNLAPEANWHLIGSLQRNKVKFLPDSVTAFHALDSFRLLDALNAQRQKIAQPLACYIQVNVTGEANKHGVTSGDVLKHWARWNSSEWVQIVGLMTMAEKDAPQERLMETFGRLKNLAEEIELRQSIDAPLRLSMGMSQDYQAAIRCGSTDLRLGSALFGQPNPVSTT